MPIVPADRVGKLQFYEAHVGPWQAAAASIGLTPASVAALSAAADEARAAYTAHLAAQDAARAATAAFYAAVRALHDAPGMGADMIQQIKTRAQTADDPGVYALAHLPAPAAPAPVPPPGTPTDFTVALGQDGALELKWKCANPSRRGGVIYHVRRRAGAATDWTFLGASGRKKFVDATIPAGAFPVTYQVTAVRSTATGNPGRFTVNFGVTGVTGAGEATAGVAGPRRAA